MNNDELKRTTNSKNPEINSASYCLSEIYGFIKEGLSKLGDEATFAELYDCERELLFRWAKEHECLYTESQIADRLKDLAQLPGGNEHVVFIDGERVIKITCPPSFGARGSLLEYLHNLLLCNKYFADDFRFLGAVENFHVSEEQEGNSIVISQPFVAGEKASEEEIFRLMDLLEMKPFKSQGKIVPHSYMDAEETIKFIDFRSDNVIKTSSGALVPIDIHIFEPPRKS